MRDVDALVCLRQQAAAAMPGLLGDESIYAFYATLWDDDEVPQLMFELLDLLMAPGVQANSLPRQMPDVTEHSIMLLAHTCWLKQSIEAAVSALYEEVDPLLQAAAQRYLTATAVGHPSAALAVVMQLADDVAAASSSQQPLWPCHSPPDERLVESRDFAACNAALVAMHLLTAAALHPPVAAALSQDPFALRLPALACLVGLHELKPATLPIMLLSEASHLLAAFHNLLQAAPLEPEDQGSTFTQAVLAEPLIDKVLVHAIARVGLLGRHGSSQPGVPQNLKRLLLRRPAIVTGQALLSVSDIMLLAMSDSVVLGTPTDLEQYEACTLLFALVAQLQSQAERHRVFTAVAVFARGVVEAVCIDAAAATVAVGQEAQPSQLEQNAPGGQTSDSAAVPCRNMVLCLLLHCAGGSPDTRAHKILAGAIMHT